MPRRAMDGDAENTSALRRQARWLEDYRPALRVSEQGRVLSVGDGIAWIDGLPTAAMDELLELEDGSRALVFHLKSERLGAILLYQTERLTAGTRRGADRTPARAAGRRRAARSRGRPARHAAGRPGAAALRPLAPARRDGAADRGPQLRRSAAVHRQQDHRHDDPDRKGPTPAADRGQRLGQERTCDRYRDQPARQEREVRVRAGGTEALHGGQHHRRIARAWRFGAHGGGGGRSHCAPRPEVPGAVRRLRGGGELDAVRRRYPGRLRRHHYACADLPRAVAAAAAAARPRGLSGRHLLSACAPVGARDLPGAA